MTGPASRALDRWALRYARWALGAAFLSGIASRFGWWGPGRGYGTFANFMKYTAQVNSFMPARTIPFLAWAATVAETSLGLALLLPLRGRAARIAALASAGLLAVFGLAMAVSFGPKEPLDYSVFSASAAALLLARRPESEAP
ncbi:hypothetical protein [Geothrix oryzisoli]|uniref:hypothetical protein n=1 Tax=Geothrix oryzisoli TaxID=2922721 RepID=UPI001FADD3F2|nr:hypothetical protein [Geothrix oryzisoli]